MNVSMFLIFPGCGIKDVRDIFKIERKELNRKDTQLKCLGKANITLDQEGEGTSKANTWRQEVIRIPSYLTW